jgi:hypothetical protein
MHYNYL